MKGHARNFSIGAILVPLALALATLIANEAQTLIGLHLDNVALSLYLLPFLAGAAAAIAALLRLEAAKIGGDLGKSLGDLASSIFGPVEPTEAGPPGRGSEASPGVLAGLAGLPGLPGGPPERPAPPPPPPPAP